MPPSPDDRGASGVVLQLICPTGAGAKLLSIPCRKNIQLFRISDLPYSRVRSALARGVSRAPRTWCGMWWTGRCREASGSGADGEVVWFWRAQATRQAVVQLQRRCGGDGGNESKAHREEHEVSRNPLRREGRSVSAVPVVNARSRNVFARGPRVHAATRPSLCPHVSRGR